MSMGQGSYVESSIPWVTEETGYSSFIKGQLLLLEGTTSMQFRSLLECETLDVSLKLAPIIGMFCLVQILANYSIYSYYSKTCLKWPLKNRQNKDLNDK